MPPIYLLGSLLGLLAGTLLAYLADANGLLIAASAFAGGFAGIIMTAIMILQLLDRSATEAFGRSLIAWGRSGERP
ncbi:hypothetical protein LAZ40_04860 [Cereibacter sphaeroides]|uniref:hypothetical protein n=1 Tax=Cereibacter sphaeroides TaxID=1063 RepID=UPI001F21979D|nr:hypothetical protein [Cereibacter sphaeroides]MCE6958387.1 hypothetical protein [Cereibacter sphaeroides]MCE6972254.1 hypothetical protein [Cereibacter sphaeroides]